ncbi:MAG: hypothetical protein Q7J07_07815 [Pelolinea sp.]|nr:hypothetical protein [Pelolinea sp.]
MHKNLIRFPVLFLLAAVLMSCSGGQPDTVPTAEGEDMVLTATPDVSPTEPVNTDGIACDLELPGPDDWEVVLCETFDDNRNAWEVESQDNPYAKYTSAIADGKFVVDYSAKGFAGYQRTALTWFTIGNEKNFALSINGLLESSFQDASWGIAFRGNEDSYFLFSIANNGTYVFEIFENDGWIPLITPKKFNGIRLGEENTLRIEAGGQDFYFSINDEMVNQFNGGLLEGREILLVVSAKEGVSATFTFDDVVLQR